jgi:hypothetical protein
MACTHEIDDVHPQVEDGSYLETVILFVETVVIIHETP